ncbi:hypothetical protein V1264_010413 [Littorina saxatilis]|uniref:PiggyBac transposable element-derived protein domain-containing protein n=1 Tax=Littorina saxatilis TaxID=31220 RepID=A0AAN9G091_9CAEN
MDRPNLFEALVAANGDDVDWESTVQVMKAVDVVEAAGSLDDPPSGEDETTDEEGPLPPLDDSSPEQSEDEPEEDEPSSQTAKDGTLWQSVPKPKVGKTPAKNVFRKPPTQLQGCQNVTTSSHAFNLFVSDKNISDVVKCTNIEGRRVKKDAWVPTNDEEIEAVIGMLLFLGTKKHNMLSTEEICDPPPRNESHVTSRGSALGLI